MTRDPRGIRILLKISVAEMKAHSRRREFVKEASQQIIFQTVDAVTEFDATQIGQRRDSRIQHSLQQRAICVCGARTCRSSGSRVNSVLSADREVEPGSSESSQSLSSVSV